MGECGWTGEGDVRGRRENGWWRSVIGERGQMKMLASVNWITEENAAVGEGELGREKCVDRKTVI